MAVHIGDVVESTGFVRRTNRGAESMLFDNLQKGQYVYPVKSTVRELVSNGIDSINEKEIARKILSGEAQESDYYYVPGTNPVLDAAIEANPGEYENSRFDRSYYDLNYLDFTQNRVLIRYLDSDNTQRDKVQIIDYGVGLNPARLEGILELGYSTKRLGKAALGKFGLGAKVALSTGIDYYTLTTHYNGRMTMFNVYNKVAEPIIPPIDNDGKNEMAHFSYDTEKKYPYFWKKFDGPNRVIVEFEIKKHRKQELISAVKSQLLYFPNVDLQIVNSDGYTNKEQVQADVIYEDDKIVISNNSQFSKPHIVINNVSYGYIDFLELETEERVGNIGIKFQPHELDVSPSRESVMWTEKTGNAVRQRFKDVEAIAEEYVSKLLEEPDFLTWYDKARALINRSGTDDRVLKAFGELVDIKSIRPVYKGFEGFETPLTYVELMAPALKVTKVTKRSVYKGGKEKLKVERDEYNGILDLNAPIYIKDKTTNYNFHSDLYMLNELHTNGFYTITFEPKEYKRPLLYKENDPKDVQQELEHKEYIRKANTISGLIAKAIMPRLQEKRYGGISAPLSYSKFTEKDDEAQDVEEDGVTITNEDRRRIDGTIPAKLLGLPYSSGTTVNGKHFEHKQEEIKLSELRELSESDEQETYYGTSKDNEIMHLVATLLRPAADMYNSIQWNEKKFYFWREASPIRLIEVSQDNQRKHGYYWNHITTFFKRFNTDTGIISMSDHLIKWNTARLIDEHIANLKFLENFGLFDAERAASYKEIKSYHHNHYKDLNGIFRDSYGTKSETQQELINYLENLAELQMTVASSPDEDIADKVREMFPQETNPEAVKGANAVDLEVLSTLNSLVEYAEPFQVLFNQMVVLTHEFKTITPELEQEIRGYMAFKLGN